MDMQKMRKQIIKLRKGKGCFKIGMRRDCSRYRDIRKNLYNFQCND